MIATVDGAGLIRARAIGTATVSATSMDNAAKAAALYVQVLRP